MNWQQEQQAFWDMISRPQDLNTRTGEINQLLAPHSQLPATEALAIYHNAFHLRLLQVSREMLPVVFNTLGEEVYQAMLLGYLEQHLPRPGPMHLLLENLEAWLRAHPRFSQLPALLDIVHVEIALIRLFDVADETVYTLDQLRALPAKDWGSLQLTARQDWQLFSSRFQLDSYWQQIRTWYSEGGTAGAADFGVPLAAPDAPDTRQDFLLMRYRQRMQIRRISPQLNLFLQGIQDNLDYAALCSRLAITFPAEDIPRLSLHLLLQTIELELLRA